MEYYQNTNRLTEEDFKKFMEENKDMYLKMKLKSGSKKILKLLYEEGYEIYFITARSKSELKEMETYTKEFFEKNNIKYKKIIFNAQDKGVVVNKYHLSLIFDDREPFLDQVKNSDILKLRYVYDKKIYSKYQKVSSWKEFYKIVKKESGCF